MDATDRILDVEFVLELVGDGFRASDDQKVVGNLVRVGRAGAGAVTRQEAPLGILIAAVAVRAIIEPEVIAGLRLAERDQASQRLFDRRIGVVGEDDSPTSLIQFLGSTPSLTPSVPRLPLGPENEARPGSRASFRPG